MYFSVPLGFGEKLTADTRLDLLLECGEMVMKMHSSALALTLDIFPKLKGKIKGFVDLLPSFEACHAEMVERLRSAARGGCKIALGLAKAHHPEINLWRVTKCMPTKDGNGKKVVPSAIYSAVSGFATHVADMVPIDTFFERKEMPPRPEDMSSDEASEQTCMGDSEEMEEEGGDDGSDNEAETAAHQSSAQSPA